MHSQCDRGVYDKTADIPCQSFEDAVGFSILVRFSEQPISLSTKVWKSIEYQKTY